MTGRMLQEAAILSHGYRNSIVATMIYLINVTECDSVGCRRLQCKHYDIFSLSTLGNKDIMGQDIFTFPKNLEESWLSRGFVLSQLEKAFFIFILTIYFRIIFNSRSADCLQCKFLLCQEWYFIYRYDSFQHATHFRFLETLLRHFTNIYYILFVNVMVYVLRL